MPILTTSASGRKLRVLLVLHELGPGAPSVPLVALSHLRREIRVHTVAPVAGRRSLEGQYRALGPLSLQPPWSTSLVHRAVRRVVLQKQRMEITRFDPDIIYVNSVQALEVARDANVPERPVVLHVHELGSYLEPLLSDQRVRLCEWPTKYVAVSEAVRRYLVDRGGISDDRVAMIHAFLADEFLSRAAGPAASATPSPRRLVVGGAGAPTWRKGIQLWLELAAALRELLPADWTVAFRWVGMADSTEAEVARFHARRLKVDDIVSFVPYTNSPKAEFETFDLFAMTSWEDPCPLVVLENMALEKPILCFAAGGGAAEQVGEAGVVIPAFEPKLMAAAAAELALDPARRLRLGAAARERVKTIFTASIQAPKLLRELRACANRP